jgi:organic radical activating enzyme
MKEVQQKIDNGLALPVMEHFYTIQGEGRNNGEAAYFIRLAGCDVGCVWCDVKESWDADEHPVLSVDEIVEGAVATNSPNIVITGGEPAMYDLSVLTEKLKQKDLKVWMETSGAHPITGSWDWICFSPKKFKKPLDEAYDKAHELKVVIANRNDFKWAESHAQKVGSDCELYLQPEWSREEKLLPKIIDYVKENPEWKISLQTHKYMNIP